MAEDSQRHVLVTGGAGFVGSAVCLLLRERHPGWKVTALDNLYRKGSELNLPRLESAGVEFSQGDVRSRDDLEKIDSIDVLVECSAEPSALSGIIDDPRFVVETNLMGAFNCLELARRDDAQFVFISTSRVYPYTRLSEVTLEESETRFDFADSQRLPGVSPEGISEDFPIDGARSMYGATKLAAELLISEYAGSLGLNTVIDRCGVIAGPWQMGKVDQGVFTFWLLSHYFERPLSYIGFGGSGKQVRDLLFVEDFAELVLEQIEYPDRWTGTTLNVGGGRDISLSLMETTRICRDLTGNEVEISAQAEGRPADVAVYTSDLGRLSQMTDWKPTTGPGEILERTFRWIQQDDELIARTLDFE